METLLQVGLSNAVMAAVIAVLVAVIARIWRRPAVVHALWILVLLKLITPPLVNIPMSLPERVPAPPAEIAHAAAEVHAPLPEEEPAPADAVEVEGDLV